MNEVNLFPNTIDDFIVLSVCMKRKEKKKTVNEMRKSFFQELNKNGKSIIW